ncbi:Gfo/Idh/MocA family oxidoreductase [Ruminococcaceae bacterium OttesenSCG-928-N02]|nr:Gfo/Idh/MocA family oxidoreductase [Ruminococcaceae bacterium OttesenSCG-928-N02]
MSYLIVGLGSMGKRRARLIKNIQPDAQILGVDFAPARREEAAGLGITPFENIADALAQGPTAAFVCTAPLSHAGIIRELLQGGVHVFTELNLVADGYEENIALAKEKGLHLMLSSTMLYRGEIQHMQKRVAAFEKPVSYIYHIGQYLPDWHPWEDYTNFFVGDARTGGCREIFGIEMPWLTETFGPVTAIHTEKDKVTDLLTTYPDRFFVTLTHEGGGEGGADGRYCVPNRRSLPRNFWGGDALALGR